MTALVARDLTLAVGATAARRVLVRDLTLRCAPGTITALVGRNGTGKTTVLRALVGLHRPDRGSVALDEVALAQLAPRQRARRLAWLPAGEPPWGDPTGLALVLLGRTPHLGRLGRPLPDDLAHAHGVLARLDAAALADRRYSTMSGGERQRVMLARMLASEAEVLVLDEPTAALDIGHALRVLALCRRLADGGATVIMSLHDLELARDRVDRVLCLTGDPDRHHVGTPAEVLTAGRVAEAFGVIAREAQRIAYSLPE